MNSSGLEGENANDHVIASRNVTSCFDAGITYLNLRHFSAGLEEELNDGTVSSINGLGESSLTVLKCSRRTNVMESLAVLRVIINYVC
jgi:hypothetical protein